MMWEGHNQPADVGFEVIGKEHLSKECRWCIQTRKYKETDSPLEPLDGNTAYWYLDCSPVRVILDFCSP